MGTLEYTSRRTQSLTLRAQVWSYPQRVAREPNEEDWVAACIEAAFPGVTVRLHDDGTRPGMHDLDLIRDDGSIFGACEVTAAADSASIELWNIVNGNGRWIEPNLAGGWMLVLSPRTRARRLLKEMPQLLQRLEADRKDASARDRLEALGVLEASQSGTDFPGSVYFTVERAPEFTGGAVPDTGDELLAWFEDWVTHSEHEHNLEKLRRSGRSERHLFVLLPGFTTAPFTASDPLMRHDGPLPSLAPTLPTGLTHVWLMSTWTTGAIFHWNTECWQRFAKARP